MAATYRISAVPTQFTGGEYKGKLKSITFTATSPNDTREWYAKNCGQFEAAFARIMPRNLARIIIAALANGDSVELPGLYEEEQFERGFLFEWSPIYFVIPSPAFPRDAEATA
jgi:hypothetical protein